MSERWLEEEYDVVVLGGGASGIAAAVSAAQNGARTVLVEAGPVVGGELLSGINLLGIMSSRGEWIVGGVISELLDECKKYGGFIGTLTDFRPLYYAAFDPEIMKIAVSVLLHRHRVDLRLYTFAQDVIVRDGTIGGIIILNKQGKTLLHGKVFIDCSGDGDLAVGAGAPFEAGDPGTGEFQSLTFVFRMIGVDSERLLGFVEREPGNFAIAEFGGLAGTVQDGIRGLRRQGLPKVSLTAKGPLLADAIRSGEMYATSLVALAPISLARREVSVNSTKISNVNAVNTKDISGAYAQLVEQVFTCVRFLKRRLPGFEQAEFSGLAPRIGIRETRRIIGEYVLTGEDVLEGRKRQDGVAKGGHPVDVWVAGTDHKWQTIAGGGSYDIPYAALIPRAVNNLFVAGRCLSSTREGQSSARVMGTCMALGQAAGTAAAMCVQSNDWAGDVRDLSVAALRAKLKAQGAVLEGTA